MSPIPRTDVRTYKSYPSLLEKAKSLITVLARLKEINTDDPAANLPRFLKSPRYINAAGALEADTVLGCTYKTICAVQAKGQCPKGVDDERETRPVMYPRGH